jgi:glycosyltransferase involved in cell wall biosynthesis
MARPVPVDSAAPEPEVSVVVTVFDEAGSLEELYRRTTAALEGRDYELIFVDDGSTDASFELVERFHDTDARVRGVKLKRNFGQHPAMHAGLARARGSIVVTMDSDLQNLPEDLPRRGRRPVRRRRARIDLRPLRRVRHRRVLRRRADPGDLGRRGRRRHRSGCGTANPGPGAVGRGAPARAGRNGLSGQGELPRCGR